MNSTTLKSNEIDLLAIALALWAKRYILIVSTLSFVVAGILYARAQPIVYHGKVVINPLNEAELIGFNEWNQGISKAVSFDRGSVSPAMSNLNYSKVTSTRLFDKFLNHYQRGQALDSALRLHSKEIKNFKGDALELATSMASLRGKFMLETDESGEVSITMATTDRSESIQILSTVIGAISQVVKEDALRSIDSILATMSLARQMEIEKLSVELEAHKRLYELRKDHSLTLLREQASVARALNLEHPAGNNVLNQTSTGYGTLGNNLLSPFESAYFLQGYSAIEKQIANVEMREDEDMTLLNGQVEHLMLTHERLVRYDMNKILRLLISATPFHDPDFVIIQADLNGVGFVSQTNKAKLTGIISFVGFMLSVITVLVNYGLRQRDVEAGAA